MACNYKAQCKTKLTWVIIQVYHKFRFCHLKKYKYFIVLMYVKAYRDVSKHQHKRLFSLVVIVVYYLSPYVESDKSSPPLPHIIP
jgi:hypothetical protein